MDLQLSPPKIQMVDLISQHDKIRPQLDAAIKEVIDTASFIKGAKVGAFECDLAAYLNAKYVIGCANGTDALQVAIMALDLPKGAEIIVPDFTFIATAEVIALLGFTPIFTDVEKLTYNLCPKALEAAITPLTKAIIPVHMLGQVCDMSAIMALAEKYNLFVIEDTAQAMGSEYFNEQNKTQKAGNIGHIGCTSFFPSKNLSCMGDGGVVFTNDEQLYHKMLSMANHGMSAQYEYAYIGINSRLDTIQAAVLGIKLKYLDEYNESRRKAAHYYTEHLKELPKLKCPTESEFGKHIYHQYTLIIEDDSRDELQAFLNKEKIPTKVYYPIPFHAHAPYSHFPHNKEKLANSIYLSHHVLSLPIHTELSKVQQDYIISKIKEFFAK